jgi:DNA repair exonuclease SbcCD ATPase subunit
MNQRSAALLTKSQREGLLRGLESSSSDRKLRQRINTRLRDSTVDHRLLFARMENNELRETFSSDLSAFKQHMQRLEEIRNRIHSPVAGIDSNISEIKQYADEMEELLEKIRSLNDRDTVNDHNSRRTEKEIRKIESEGESIYRDILEVIHDSEDSLEEIIDRSQAIINSSDQFQLFLKDEYSVFIQGIKQVHADFKEVKSELDLLLNDINQFERVFQSGDNSRHDYPYTEIGLSQRAEKVNKLSEEYRRRHRLRRRRQHNSKPKLVDCITILEKHLNRRALSPDTRENVVKSIGFYLRVIDAVDADLEQMTEEAIESTITTHCHDKILDSVSVNIKTESKSKALKQGKQKIGKSRLSNAELRALAENNDDISKIAGIDGYSLQDLLLKRVLEEPDLLGSNIEFLEIEPTIEYHGMPVRASLMGNDSEGNTVLINIEVGSSEDLAERLERMELLIDAVDGDEEVRGIIVVPLREFENKKSIRKDEFPRVDVRPISSK